VFPRCSPQPHSHIGHLTTHISQLLCIPPAPSPATSRAFCASVHVLIHVFSHTFPPCISSRTFLRQWGFFFISSSRTPTYGCYSAFSSSSSSSSLAYPYLWGLLCFFSFVAYSYLWGLLCFFFFRSILLPMGVTLLFFFIMVEAGFSARCQNIPLCNGFPPSPVCGTWVGVFSFFFCDFSRHLNGSIGRDVGGPLSMGWCRIL